MNIEVKNIINIFTIIDGEINLLVKNNDLIKIICDDDLDLVNHNYIINNIDVENLKLQQCHTFSKKEDNKLVLTILYVDIVNADSIKLNDQFSFIKLDNLDKNNIYIIKCIEYLKEKLVLYSTMKKLYPNEFVLPEIQKIYEKVLNKRIDRRNFRKKLIKLDIIENLDKISSNSAGRPAKLYKFKKISEERVLF